MNDQTKQKIFPCVERKKTGSNEIFRFFNKAKKLILWKGKWENLEQRNSYPISQQGWLCFSNFSKREWLGFFGQKPILLFFNNKECLFTSHALMNKNVKNMCSQIQLKGGKGTP